MSAEGVEPNKAITATYIQGERLAGSSLSDAALVCLFLTNDPWLSEWKIDKQLISQANLSSIILNLKPFRPLPLRVHCQTCVPSGSDNRQTLCCKHRSIRWGRHAFICEEGIAGQLWAPCSSSCCVFFVFYLTLNKPFTWVFWFWY